MKTDHKSQGWSVSTIDQYEIHDKKASKYHVKLWTQVMRLEGIVEVAFRPDTHLYFSRTQHLPGSSEAQETLNVEWPLGALVTTVW